MKRYIAALAVLVLSMAVSGCGKNASEDGVEYLKNGQYKEAVEQFEKAVKDDVNAGDAYRGIGIAKWEQEDYEGAKNAFEKALDHDAKKTGTIYNFLGNCEMKLDNPSGALNYYKLGLGSEGISDKLEQEMRFNTICAYEKMEDWESAKLRLKEYTADYPDDEKAVKEAEFLKVK